MTSGDWHESKQHYSRHRISLKWGFSMRVLPWNVTIHHPFSPSVRPYDLPIVRLFLGTSEMIAAVEDIVRSWLSSELLRPDSLVPPFRFIEPELRMDEFLDCFRLVASPRSTRETEREHITEMCPIQILKLYRFRSALVSHRYRVYTSKGGSRRREKS